MSATYNDYRAPLSASYELDVFGRVRHAYASAQATGEAAEADRQAVALSLSAEIARAYFALRALDSQVAVLRQGAGLRQDAVRLSQERVNAGVAGGRLTFRARASNSTTRRPISTKPCASAPKPKTTSPRSPDNPPAYFAYPCVCWKTPRRRRSRPACRCCCFPAARICARPSARLAAASEDIGVARADFLPTFNIQGNAGLEAAYGSELFDTDSRALSVMGTVHIPIFEGGRNLANLRAARARRDAALAAYRGTAITAYKEVETALSDLRQRAAQAEARRRAVVDAGQVLNLSQKRYLEGAVNYFDVVDAQRSRLGAELNGVQTLEARFRRHGGPRARHRRRLGASGREGRQPRPAIGAAVRPIRPFAGGHPIPLHGTNHFPRRRERYVLPRRRSTCSPARIRSHASYRRGHLGRTQRPREREGRFT